MTIQRLVFVTKIRSATLATKILKNQGLVLKTIGVNFVVNYGQFKIRYSYSVFRILYAVRGVLKFSD